MLKEILGAVKSPEGKVSNENLKGRINKDNEESEDGDDCEDPHGKKSGWKDYSDILDPDRSNVELMSYCQCTLNRCALPTYTPNCLPGGCTGKTASYLTKNLLGFII